jgi:hypothetical protein
VEVDGNQLPPNIINKLNIFMVNVLRFKGGTDMSGLVDKAGSHNKRFSPAGGPSPEDAAALAAALASGECAACDTECAACGVAAECVKPEKKPELVN